MEAKTAGTTERAALHPQDESLARTMRYAARQPGRDSQLLLGHDANSKLPQPSEKPAPLGPIGRSLPSVGVLDCHHKVIRKVTLQTRCESMQPFDCCWRLGIQHGNQVRRQLGLVVVNQQPNQLRQAHITR